MTHAHEKYCYVAQPSIDKKFTEREAKSAFAFAVPFVTDELHQYGKGGAVDQLTLICFIEALARSAELMDGNSTCYQNSSKYIC